MRILLTNDDGIYAPGLAAMERVLQSLGEVMVVAPATEQSGVGHSITFLQPLTCKEIYDQRRRRGWAVEGSPADCVKLAVHEICPTRPDLVISGINGGLNAGINVLYSGTVAAAIEGAFFGITSIAVSLEYDEHADFDSAAHLALGVIRQILAYPDHAGKLFNVNIPTVAIQNPRGVRAVPMCVRQRGEGYIRRQDPKGRTYFWSSPDPQPTMGERETDLTALLQGYVTVTPLQYDMTRFAMLDELQRWPWQVAKGESKTASS